MTDTPSDDQTYCEANHRQQIFGRAVTELQCAAAGYRCARIEPEEARLLLEIIGLN